MLIRKLVDLFRPTYIVYTYMKGNRFYYTQGGLYSRSYHRAMKFKKKPEWAKTDNFIIEKI